MTTQDSSIYSDPAVRAAIRETIAESATSSGSASDWIDDMAAEKTAIRDENRDAAAVEAADGATREQAREVYARTLAAPDDEAVDSALVYIAARATALMQARLGADRSGTVSGLRELASLVDEALEAAGAARMPAAGWTLETTPPDGARAIIADAEWHHMGGDRWVQVVPLPDDPRVIGTGDVRDRHGRLTLLPVNAAPAPQPVAETPADDSPAGQLLHAARVAAGLIERLGDRIYRPNVRHNDINVITGGDRYDDPWAGDLRYLANLRECVSILGATVTARITATGGLTVAAKCVIDGVDVRIAAPLDPGSPAEPVARAWLAELGVEVQS